MSFTLPDLPYAYNALEPHIDEQTMRIHHDKHHAAYVSKLNAALEGHDNLAGQTIEALMGNLGQVPEGIRSAVRNNGGGHCNHTLFWDVMAPGGPSGNIEEIDAAVAGVIDGFPGFARLLKTFGGLDDFRKQFNTAGATRFGSGWAWLTVDAKGNLAVESTPNQDTPLMDGRTPILGCDVWEHAYYLKYQNRRPDYLEAWWNVVNWQSVARRYQAATA